jgi:hypothetical protein
MVPPYRQFDGLPVPVLHHLVPKHERDYEAAATLADAIEAYASARKSTAAAALRSRSTVLTHGHVRRLRCARASVA